MASGQEAEKKGKGRVPDYANDERFKAVGSDPRFRRFPKKTTKVQVDERFAGMLKDEAFQTGSNRDKRGATVKIKDKRKDLKALYDVRSEEQDEEERAAELAEADERWAKMRGIGVASESEESSSEEEELEELQEEFSDEDEEDRRAREVFGVGAMAANPQEEITLVEDATSRLAAVDLDWAHIKAVDILAVLHSFLPAHGRIVRVTVYPSDYGLQRMAEEATVGPQGVWAGDKGNDDEGADSDTERRRRRAYELSRLRHYYAIIEFDSVATASKIYEECDGTEFLKSACKFDLRFVPEDQTFEGRQIREVAEDVPVDYKPPIFQTMALQSTDPDISWDAPDSNRRQFLNKKLTADEIKEDDFKAYLASGTDESESNSSGDEDNDGPEDAESVRARYRALLLGGGTSGVEEKGDDEDDQAKKDKEMELQVTFQSGLESLSQKLMAKAARGKKGEAETVWDAYVRRRAEKKAAAQRLGRRNAGSSDEETEDEPAAPSSSGSEQEDDPFFQHEENPFDDPFFNDGAEPEKNKAGEREKARSKKKSGVLLSEGTGEGLSDAAQKAELEMLLMDDPQERMALGKKENEMADSEKKKKKLSMKERIRQRKQARRREREEGSDEESVPAGPSAKSLDDPRFASLLTSSAFALDPTDPRFDTRSATLAKKVAERRSRTEAPVPPPLVEEEVKKKHDGGPSEKSALQLMVKSLKRKSQKGNAGQEPSKMRRN